MDTSLKNKSIDNEAEYIKEEQVFQFTDLLIEQ